MHLQGRWTKILVVSATFHHGWAVPTSDWTRRRDGVWFWRIQWKKLSGNWPDQRKETNRCWVWGSRELTGLLLLLTNQHPTARAQLLDFLHVKSRILFLAVPITFTGSRSSWPWYSEHCHSEVKQLQGFPREHWPPAQSCRSWTTGFIFPGFNLSKFHSLSQ